jgi:phosphatidylserine/phosphatidylglycerophosphate/cardiolipin synthase-like enzyme
MHEKFIDDGGHIYVGSANLTGNGLDVGYEIGVVARASDFAGDAALLRADFDAMWDAAMPCEAPRLAQARSEQ